MTIADETNVVVFAPRPVVEPELEGCDLRLIETDGKITGIAMTVFDIEGNVAAVLGLNIATMSPETFDPERLRPAWTRWRQASAVCA